MERRKLGKSISIPISELVMHKRLDSVCFIEQNHKLAEKTRAAACMYIGRHDYDLTTKVEGNKIWVLRDKDITGRFDEYDLRP